MARSPSPSSSKRRRVDGDAETASPRRDRTDSHRSERRDDDRGDRRRESGSSRRHDEGRDSGRSSRRERDDRGRRGERDSHRRSEPRDRSRDRHQSSSRRRDDSRSRSPERHSHRRDHDERRPRSRTPGESRPFAARAPSPPHVSKTVRGSFQPISGGTPALASSSTAGVAPRSPMSAPGTPIPGAEDEKLKLKREKLEAWKRDREAKKAAAAVAVAAPAPASAPLKSSLPPKPIASFAPMSTATSKLPAARASSSLPAKPSFSFSSAASTSAFKPSALNNTLSFDGNEDTSVKVGMVQFDTAAVDMTMDVVPVEGDEDEEDLEAGASYKAREGGRDAFDVEMVEQVEEDTKMEEEEDEVDELEAFMSGVTKQVKTVDASDKARLLSVGNGKKVNLGEPEVDYADEVESEDEVDKVGNSAEAILALAAKKVKRGKELAPVDHSKIDYEPFRREFYHPPPEVELLTAEEVEELRIEMDGIKVRGADPPKPVSKWSYCGLPASCIEVINGLEYAAPTSIQAQAIPAIMAGRDIIGVAKTGSGKTIAFLLPMFRHIKDQRALTAMEGPIAMIMTPTRELATQIHRECKPFLKAMGLRASCAYGGTPLKDNIAEMKRGSEVVVCTPGRMIELLTTNSGRIINLHRITYLVLDEADRMFDMGFEPQVMKIINQIRPDRQTVLFSATFPRQMEALARKILHRPLEITVGGRSIVAPEIEQIVEVREEEDKFLRLLELLGRLSNEDADARTLIFVERQEGADNLLKELLKKNYSCMPLHGGMEQVDRDQTIADFKSGVVPVVIATSVAARGLDVKQLKLVVQYDAPNHMEDYVHRAGRTGRAGNKGTCVTFVTKEQDRYALDIYKALVASNANVPADFKALAESFAEKVKAGKATGSGSGFGGKGLERLDQDRDASSRAERAAYGEAPGAEAKVPVAGAPETKAASTLLDPSNLEVEIHRGPAPDSSRGSGVLAYSDTSGKGAGGLSKAQSVAANINALLKARTRGSETDHSTESSRRRDPDATDYHAIIFINDYPQKARWKVTNKETMVLLVDSTGASITSKGTFYEPGKEPGPGDLPKLHFLIESNDEFRVKHAISEIKRSLIEGATIALEAEQRNPGSSGPPGRYTV